MRFCYIQWAVQTEQFMLFQIRCAGPPTPVIFFLTAQHPLSYYSCFSKCFIFLFHVCLCETTWARPCMQYRTPATAVQYSERACSVCTGLVCVLWNSIKLVWFRDNCLLILCIFTLYRSHTEKCWGGCFEGIWGLKVDRHFQAAAYINCQKIGKNLSQKET